MKDENYFIVFFDYENNYDNEEKIVKNTIESLFSFYYRNCSLKISRNVLLIKHNPELKYLDIQHYVNETFDEQIEKRIEERGDCSHTIKIFVLPVQLNTIKNHLSRFKKEIEYINTKDD